MSTQHQPVDLGLPQTMTVQQAADALGVSHHTITSWIRKGTLPAYKVGDRRVMLLGVDVEAMIRPRPVSGQS